MERFSGLAHLGSEVIRTITYSRNAPTGLREWTTARRSIGISHGGASTEANANVV